MSIREDIENEDLLEGVLESLNDPHLCIYGNQLEFNRNIKKKYKEVKIKDIIKEKIHISELEDNLPKDLEMSFVNTSIGYRSMHYKLYDYIKEQVELCKKKLESKVYKDNLQYISYDDYSASYGKYFLCDEYGYEESEILVNDWAYERIIDIINEYKTIIIKHIHTCDSIYKVFSPKNKKIYNFLLDNIISEKLYGILNEY